MADRDPLNLGTTGPRRSPLTALLDLKPGVGMLAAHFSEVAIIPTWIEGSLDAWPRERKLPRLLPITVRFGEPLDPRELAENAGAGTAADRITNGLKAALQRLQAAQTS